MSLNIIIIRIIIINIIDIILIKNLGFIDYKGLVLVILIIKVKIAMFLLLTFSHVSRIK